MDLRAIALGAVTALSSVSVPAYSFAACDARSGPKTAALVELYTSEGCSSCPPADRQLSRLRQALDPAAKVVPLALHVGYWDYIGWKDPYAQAAFGERQNRLVHANQRRTVYTPQFFARMDRAGSSDRRRSTGAARDYAAGCLEPRAAGGGRFCSGRTHRQRAAGGERTPVRGLLIADEAFP
jgi:hypothetical protein